MATTQTQKPETGGGVEGLCTAILIQAVLDYQDLCQRGVASVKTRKEGSYSKNAITRFFKSEWCARLLATIGGHITGESIIAMLKERGADIIPNKEPELAAYTLDGKFVGTFATLKDAADFSNQNTTKNIIHCCKGRRKSSGGYVWKYI